MLTVTIYPDADSLVDDNGHVEKVDYVSLVNNDTYGPPALIAPAPPNARDKHRAAPGEEVLYINLSLIPVYKIVEDE